MKKKLFYIRKGFAFYRANARGYTEKFWEAGIYTEKEADAHLSSCSELEKIPVDIHQHNAVVNEHIEELKKHLINNE